MLSLQPENSPFEGGLKGVKGRRIYFLAASSTREGSGRAPPTHRRRGNNRVNRGRAQRLKWGESYDRIAQPNPL